MQCDLGNATYMQVLLTPTELGLRKLVLSQSVVMLVSSGQTTGRRPLAITVLMGRAMSGTEKCICQ